jgi:glycosyltransferase involved in cell wall biosynthesis
MTATRLRAGFVMEQVLGHVSHYDTLRRVVERDSHEIDPRWIEVTYAGNGRIERLNRLPESVRGTLRGFLQVREGLRRGPLDAVLFHTQKPAVFQWGLMRHTPSVLSLDVTPRQYDDLGEFYDHAADGATPVAYAKHWINRRTFALARCIVVWSHWVKDSLMADYGVPPDKVRVIPPGVDLSQWTVRPERLDHADRLPRVLFVGGDFDRKGGPLLLDWFRRSGRGRCELDVVTRAAIAEEPGVRVHRGIVGNSAESRRLFSDADVFVLPSLGECFGIASVEAMAAGLPVVATAVGGAGDIVDQARTGFLIQPGSMDDLNAALEQLLADAGLRRRMGRAGRARAERLFDGAANAHALVDCLKRVA